MTQTDSLVMRLACEAGLAARDPLTAGAGSLDEWFRRGILSPRQAVELLAGHFDVPVAIIPEDLEPGKYAARVSPEWWCRRRVLPLREHRGALEVAVADPDGLAAAASLEAVIGIPVRPGFASAVAIDDGLDRIDRYLAGTELPVKPDHVAEDPAVSTGEPDDHGMGRLLADAVRMGASDVHLEPAGAGWRVRLRIDGRLRSHAAPGNGAGLLARLKLAAGLNPSEAPRPKDARFVEMIGGRAWDCRLSCLPSARGESLVVRLLNGHGPNLRLNDLGFAPEDQERLRRILSLPDGLLLAAGPTGSGKTTTLHACLESLNEPSRKIITVEDPVEYRLPGAVQVSVNSAAGLDFAAALRAILRHAPNVILVGEIRDRETAALAVGAALTGHFVLSTVHTHDAPAAAGRLVELGVHPMLIAAALRGVVAQRLLRLRCPRCREGSAGSSACPRCGGGGYAGRRAIFQVLVPDKDFRGALSEGAGTVELRRRARFGGMPALREIGLQWARDGLTTREEVIVSVDDADESAQPENSFESCP